MRISLGSGATLATQLIDGAHYQIISGVTLNPSPSQIGSVTISNTPGVTQSGIWNVGLTGLVSLPSGTEVRSLATILNFPATQNVALTHLVSLASGTLVGLNPSTSQIGSVTIANTPAVTQSGTWTVGVNTLVSLASGTEVRSLATVLNFPATQAVTQSGTWNVGVTGLVSLASGTEVRSLATVLNFPAVQTVALNHLVSLASGTLVGLNPSANHIGSVSIFGSVNVTPGMTTLFPGPNQIGSVTISNTPAVTQSGTWNVGINSLVTLGASPNHIGSVSIFGSLSVTPGMTTLFPGPNFIGLVTTVPGAVTPISDNGGSITIDGSIGVTGLISLASGTEVRSLATILNFPATQNVALTHLVSLASGTEIRSLATILNFPATQPVTQSGTWTVQPGNTANTTPWLVTQSGGLISLASGTFVSLNAGTNNIGDVDVLTLPATPAGANFIGLVSVQGNINIQSGATVTPVFRTNITSLATVISASGNATLFTVPSSNRWVLKDLIIGSQGQTQVGIRSGANDVIPPIALASMGGYIANFGESGFRGKAVNDSFVIVNNSGVTISVTANVWFEA